MKTKSYTSHNIISSAFKIAEQMPPLKSRKNPTIAAAAGLAFGTFGLALYFGSLEDFFVPMGIWIVLMLLAVPTFGLSVIGAAVFCAAFGYKRAKCSNARLAYSPTEIIEAEIVSEQSSIQMPRSVTTKTNTNRRSVC